ncbi:hypothetical protein PFUGPA_02992 [Plasmodium falciparum Palo Alto/Uganda]|uniref:Uncharacterized protein n=2 Tax=Plasmodium falciparum TaxID=5833 RepID=W4J0K4_PLAFP|nr:hypothetical protein PFNF135_02645 [Plasmodium falciparum NF135/5.C10]ETW55172.1 hypothetical protein PFUGPA_02992 [Plasmodium falciparum Palo Alto/Uganda]
MLKKVILLTFYFFCCYKCEKFKDSSFQSQNNRFLQSKINVLTWLTNVLYPSENPKYFKKHLNYRGCREYFLKPSYDPINLNDGWLQSDNWIIHNEEAIIEYTAKDSCREPV